MSLQLLPRWITLQRDEDPETVAFLSGAALATLDAVLRDPNGTLPCALLRDRMALDSAVACLKLEGRNESGSDIRDARLRRGLPASVVAERAGIARSTYHKIEKGDAGVSIGIYAAVLQALNLMDGLADLADAKNDPQGAHAALERLPKRAVLARKKPGSKGGS